MKNTITLLCAAIVTLASCKNKADSTTDAKVTEAKEVASATGGTVYEFTSDSVIGFTGSKVTGSQSGGFKEFTGNFSLKDGEPIAGEFTIKMESTWSESEKLTKHLKNEDFFDVEKFPESTFKVTSFNKKSDQDYELSGNLTLHGVTKNITFPTKVAKEEGKIKVDAEFDINRKNFDIVYPGMSDDLIRDEVIMKLKLEAKPKT